MNLGRFVEGRVGVAQSIALIVGFLWWAKICAVVNNQKYDQIKDSDKTDLICIRGMNPPPKFRF